MCKVLLLDMPGPKGICMGEGTILLFYGAEKEQALLLKQGRFRVDFRRDFLMGIEYSSTYELGQVTSVWVCLCVCLYMSGICVLGSNMYMHM